MHVITAQTCQQFSMHAHKPYIAFCPSNFPRSKLLCKKLTEIKSMKRLLAWTVWCNSYFAYMRKWPLTRSVAAYFWTLILIGCWKWATNFQQPIRISNQKMTPCWKIKTHYVLFNSQVLSVLSLVSDTLMLGNGLIISKNMQCRSKRTLRENFFCTMLRFNLVTVAYITFISTYFITSLALLSAYHLRTSFAHISACFRIVHVFA